jgi:hypothetical protein
MEQKAQLSGAIEGHREGQLSKTEKETIDVGKCATRCSSVPKKGTDREKQNILEAEARSRFVEFGDLNSQEKARILQKVTSEQKNEDIKRFDPGRESGDNETESGWSIGLGRYIIM